MTDRNPTAFLKDEYDALVEKDFDWKLKNLEGPSQPRCKIDGKDVIMFCANNYLGISNHPRMKKAMIAATEKYGCGSGSVRPIAGKLAHGGCSAARAPRGQCGSWGTLR